jgi:hypothetical protein
MFPNGEEVNASSFYEPELWENALRAVGIDSAVPADAMAEVRIARQLPAVDENGYPIEENTQLRFKLTIPSGSAVFADSDEKAAFLRVFSEEYKNLINSRYFSEGSVGILYGDDIRKWNNLLTDILWDAFSFERNFELLSARYSALERFFEEMYTKAPLYRSADGRSFNDFAGEFRDMRVNEIRPWLARFNDNVYIRDIDRFRNEYRFQIDSLRLNREYSLEIVAMYNDLLTSFQQKDAANGTIVAEAVEILSEAKSQSNAAAELQRQIGQMEHNAAMLETHEQTIRTNSREAEAALFAFIGDLEASQEELDRIILEYYRQLSARNAENSIIFTTPTVARIAAEASSASMTRVLMLLVGLTFAGFAIGFCAAFVKKYLPEKKEK